jgi:hypothetical protein
LIYRAHAVCFCTLVAILDPSPIVFLINILYQVDKEYCYFIKNF